MLSNRPLMSNSRTQSFFQQRSRVPDEDIWLVGRVPFRRMGCASCSQGERPTEAVDGGATEMDLQYGDNEESDAVAISICVVDESDDPGADSRQYGVKLRVVSVGRLLAAK